MFDLSVATLNMQVIALAVFFGMLAAWTARCVWRRVVKIVWFCTGASYAFLRKKYGLYRASQQVSMGKVAICAEAIHPGCRKKSFGLYVQSL